MHDLHGPLRLASLAAAVALSLSACPSGNNACADAGAPAYGGPVSGPVDNHCYVLSDGGFPGAPVSYQPIDWNSCNLDDGGPCTVALPDGGDGGACPPFGATNYDTEADDDDCKYEVGWWSTPIQYNPGGASATCDTGPCVTFFVSAKYAADGRPMTGNPTTTGNDQIAAEIESDSGNGLPPPNVNGAKTTQIQPGVYQIGPFALNAHGQWQVRFHFNEECLDSWANSPHGHAAFYFTVP